jgi:hypothetical protein
MNWYLILSVLMILSMSALFLYNGSDMLQSGGCGGKRKGERLFTIKTQETDEIDKNGKPKKEVVFSNPDGKLTVGPKGLDMVRNPPDNSSSTQSA